MKFSSLFVLASIVFSSFASTVTDVEADITSISTHVDSFQKAINSDATDIQLIRGIQLAINSLFRSLEKARKDSNDLDTKPVSEDDGNTIIKPLQSLESKVEQALKDFVAKKPAIKKYLNAAAAKRDLNGLKTGYNDLGTALKGILPDDLKDKVTAFTKTTDKALDDAATAYANA